MGLTKIEWADYTFNPWMGCTKVSPACANCYAERDMDHHWQKVKWGPSGTRVRTSKANWRKPIRWNESAECLRTFDCANNDHSDACPQSARPRVFCASLADVFEDWTGPIHGSGRDEETLATDDTRRELITLDHLRAELFQLIDETPNLDWLLLTKRPENVSRMWRGGFRPNVWLGTSIENQEWADRRLPYLHHAKRERLCARTFVSAEPLVGPIILQGESAGRVYNHLGGCGLDWVITGGESGPNARAADPAWFRMLRDQCKAASVPFHFKQWGEFDEREQRVGKKAAGRLLDGRTHDGVPIGQTPSWNEYQEWISSVDSDR